MLIQDKSLFEISFIIFYYWNIVNILIILYYFQQYRDIGWFNFDHIKTIVGQHPRIMDDSIILQIMVVLVRTRE